MILSYDVRAKRVAAARKIVRQYLRPVQRSVYEGTITESRLERLKAELLHRLDCEEDSIRIYKLHTVRYVELDQLGVVPQSDTNVL